MQISHSWMQHNQVRLGQWLCTGRWSTSNLIASNLYGTSYWKRKACLEGLLTQEMQCNATSRLDKGYENIVTQFEKWQW